MKKGVLSVVVLFLMGWMVHATDVLEFSPDTFFVDPADFVDTLMVFDELSDTLDVNYDDADYYTLHVIAGDTLVYFPPADTSLLKPIDFKAVMRELDRTRPSYAYLSVSPRFLRANPFFIELNFNGYHSVLDSFPVITTDYFLKQKKDFLIPSYYKPKQIFSVERHIIEARTTILRYLAAYHPGLIAYRVDKLPDVSDLINFQMEVTPVQTAVRLVKPDLSMEIRRLEMQKVKQTFWNKQSQAMLQFSQNYISKNWYQGGNDNMAILGIINGRFNYNDKKNIQWDNFVEWRLGFNSVDGDTTRFLNTNDDIVRANSKLGIKAGGNWFYSTNMDFSTHLFNSYRGINSTQMRATFLTPVRFNLAVGMDYKYQNKLSLFIAPVSYRFIYANDTTNINQRSFGIERGEKVLSQIGSSFRIQNTINPSRDVRIDSKFSFYTNYEKVEIDWEIVGNFTVNRFLTTRLMLNPRYDNTVILPNKEKARIQFKQLLTFGLSYRLL
jgi:hypothetical protein